MVDHVAHIYKSKMKKTNESFEVCKQYKLDRFLVEGGGVDTISITGNWTDLLSMLE